MEQPIRILLLEDKYDDAQIMQNELERAGLVFQCVTVKTQEDYLEQLKPETDLILADYSLPHFNALLALELLKDHGHLDIPFIVVSGVISEQIAVECMKRGATDYLLKDRLTRLGHAVKQALHEKSLRDQARLLERSEQEQRQLALALSDTVRALSTSLDLDKVMDALLDSVGRVVPHDASNIMLIEERSLRLTYWRGYDVSNQALLGTYRFSLDHPVLRAMIETGVPYLCPDPANEPHWMGIPAFERIRARVSVPIQAHDVTIGFLNLDSTTPDAFTIFHAEQLLAFASEAAIAIENAQLYKRIRSYADELEERVEERTRELSQAKQGVEAILNSTSDGIILIQADYSVDRANPAFCQMFGYQSEQVIGQSLERFCDQTSFESWINAIQILKERRAPVRLDLIACRHDGSLFDAEVALSLINPDETSVIVCSLRDISDRKQTEKRLQKALEQERELRELKSRFIAIVSHEFRNPLSVIQMSTTALQNYSQKLDATQRSKYFENINSRVQHMTSLLEDVLTMESNAADGGSLNLVPTDLVRLCQDVISGFQTANGQTGQIVFSHDGLQLESVLLDRKLIRQLITNLVSNAIKYSPDHGVVYVDLTCDSRSIELRVRDEGIGIPERDQERLFQPFNRAGNIGDVPGTGLGLVVAKSAVDLHGGTIRFDSVEGVGTTFIVTLPL